MTTIARQGRRAFKSSSPYLIADPLIAANGTPLDATYIFLAGTYNSTPDGAGLEVQNNAMFPQDNGSNRFHSIDFVQEASDIFIEFNFQNSPDLVDITSDTYIYFRRQSSTQLLFVGLRKIGTGIAIRIYKNDGVTGGYIFTDNFPPDTKIYNIKLECIGSVLKYYRDGLPRGGDIDISGTEAFIINKIRLGCGWGELVAPFVSFPRYITDFYITKIV